MSPIVLADSTLDLFAVSHLLSISSLERARASMERTSRCRTLLGRRRVISGGADGELPELVRGRLRNGSLKAATWRCWPAPRATGHRCLVCDLPIVEPDVDYLVAGAPLRHAHGPCYDVWVKESVSLKIADQLDLKSPVCLRSDGATVGKVMATVEQGAWIYVLWSRRVGYEGKLTRERATDLGPVADRPGAIQ